jgi:hypothetical protein
MVTHRWNGGFLYTSVHDVSTDTYANGKEAHDNPVSDPCPLESFVVGPWLNVSDEAISPIETGWLKPRNSLSSQTIALECSRLFLGKGVVSISSASSSYRCRTYGKG